MNTLLLRHPTFPLNMLKDYYSSDSDQYVITLFSKNALFQESVYLYSKILYNQSWKLLRGEIQDIKIKNKIIYSLSKYFLRMCYRSTPFGVSASVSIIEFGNMSFNSPKYTQKIKIDTEYLCKLLYKINSELKYKLVYFLNNTVFENNGYYRYIERRLNPTLKIFEYQLTKIEKTECLEIVHRLSVCGISFQNLKAEFQKDNDLEEEEILEFINDLIDSQFIVSSLGFDIFNQNLITDILKKLIEINIEDNDPIILNFIDEIKLLLESMSSVEADPNIILNKLNYNFQVDLYDESINYIPLKCKNEIEKNIKFLTNINIRNSPKNHLNVFKNHFKERYGTNSVPILEALDPECGLGYPVVKNYTQISSFLSQFKTQESIKAEYPTYSSWSKFVFDKYDQALRQNINIIHLTKEDLKQFSSNDNNQQNDSILLTGQIFKTYAGKYLYYLCSLKKGCAQSGAGRFDYGSKKIEKFCNDISKFEMNSSINDIIYAEILHLSQPKTGNIASRKNYYKYYIPFYDDSINRNDSYRIELQDIYLKLLNNELILFSKKNNKQITPRLSTAQNTSLYTYPIFRFLGDIANDSFLGIWNWDLCRQRKYFPRVQFYNFIISKEKWVINRNDVFKSGKFDIADLKNYLIKNNVCENITFGLEGGDNILPININNKSSLEILYRELLNNSYLILEECLFLNDYRSITIDSNDHAYSHEMQIPFLLDNNNDFVVKPKIEKEERVSTDHINLMPCRGCLYLKIYSNNENFDKNYLIKLFDFIFEKNIHYDYFFFIRYVESDDYHIRIRFFSEFLDVNNILSIINESFNEEISNGDIRKIQIDTYERELERYGGLDGIIISEKLFYFDSICVLRLLKEQQISQEDLWLIGLLGVHKLLSDFSLDNDNKIKLLKGLKNSYSKLLDDNKAFNKSINYFFHQNAEIIFFVVNKGHKNNVVNQIFEERSSNNRQAINDLTANNVNYRIENFVHMFMNRFFEFNQNKQELIIYSLLIKHYQFEKYNTQNS